MCERCNRSGLGNEDNKSLNCICNCLKESVKFILLDRLGKMYEKKYYEPYCPLCNHFTLIESDF